MWLPGLGAAGDAVLRIHNLRREQIALHALAEPGKFTTDVAHLHSRKRHIVERGADYLLDRCRLIGPLTGTWAEAMHQARGPQRRQAISLTAFRAD